MLQTWLKRSLLEDCAHNYAQHGKPHTYAMFGALTDAISGIIGAIHDHAATGREAKSPPVVEPPCTMHTTMLPDVAATMARLEQRLNKTATEVADLIVHVDVIQWRTSIRFFNKHLRIVKDERRLSN